MKTSKHIQYSLSKKLTHNTASMPTLSDYLGVSRIQIRISCSPCSTSHQISRIIQIKVHKIHLSDIFWPILGIFGKTFLILDEFSRFNRKTSTLNNATEGQKRQNQQSPEFLFIYVGISDTVKPLSALNSIKAVLTTFRQQAKTKTHQTTLTINFPF